MKTQENPRISVVIIVKDEVFIRDTLVALREQCKIENAECVVIDASEGRIDHVRDQNRWVNWFDFQTPLGMSSTISIQRNVGIRVARAPIIMFCDAGNIPDINWIRRWIFFIFGCILSSHFKARAQFLMPYIYTAGKSPRKLFRFV